MRIHVLKTHRLNLSGGNKESSERKKGRQREEGYADIERRVAGSAAGVSGQNIGVDRLRSNLSASLPQPVGHTLTARQCLSPVTRPRRPAT